MSDHTHVYILISKSGRQGFVQGRSVLSDYYPRELTEEEFQRWKKGEVIQF